MLKVGKLCSTRFITVIKTYDGNTSYYKHEGSSFITNELGDFELSVFSRTYKLTAAFLAKLTVSPVGFEHRIRVRKIRDIKMKNITFFHLYRLLGLKGRTTRS